MKEFVILLIVVIFALYGFYQFLKITGVNVIKYFMKLKRKE